MGFLNLPRGVEGAFQIETVDAFDRRFSVHVYGVGKQGWLVANYRSARLRRETGIRALPRGEWVVLRHHVERAGFWSLPPDGAHLDRPGWMSLDGLQLTVAGRIGDRTHRVVRENEWEPGLDAIHSFACRLSGFYTRRAPGDPWRLSIGPDPESAPPD